MGTVFAIFMGLFGLTGVYTSSVGTNDYGVDRMYFLTAGLIRLAIVLPAGLSISKVT